jgi:anti-sigma factor RsiW
MTMQCDDSRRVADAFLSGALDPETGLAVKQHLESCSDCRADMAARRAVRDRLRRAFDASDTLRPRPELAAGLRARLHPPQGRWSRRSVLQSWWALAAGAVLAVSGTVLVRQQKERSRVAALAQVAAGDHQNCAVTFRLAEQPIPMGTPDAGSGFPIER